MKFISFLRKSATEVNDPRRITFRVIIPKITSIWFSHELCLGVYTNRIRWLRSDKKACRLATDFKIPRTPFLPNFSSIPHTLATQFTRVSEQWMFKLSNTNTHDASGSVRTVRSMWLAKSASVRVGPMLGAINSPVVTTKLPIRLKVPCRVYSNSIRWQCSGIIGRLWALRSNAWMPVISSVLTVWVPRSEEHTSELQSRG